MAAHRPRRDLRLRARLRPTLIVIAAVIAALATTGAAGVTPARAATDQLRLAVATTYRVDAPRAVVHVTLDITATNLKPDTATRYYWYDAFWFYVQRQARSVTATSKRSRLAVSTKPGADSLKVTVHIPNLYSHKTRRIRLAFDLPNGTARSSNPIRVGRAHIAFTAWAWGDRRLASVKVILPAGFNSRVKTTPSDSGHALIPRTVDGHQTFSTSRIDAPYSWSATIDGSNADALTNAPVDRSGEAVLVHAWPEDTRWRQRVETVIGDSLPDLKAAIGLPWPNTRPLDVTEVAAADIAGYAGIYDTSYDDIVISEDLDDLTIVHEVSHAWFNDSLFQERWVGEGLAEEYAARILSARSGAARQEPVPLSPVGRGLFQLNDWPRPSTDRPNEMYEAFGYNTSWAVMRAIVDDVTEAKMRDVFEAAAAEKLTYVGAVPAESSGFVPDWRRFLDIVEDVGGATRAEELFAAWVALPAQRDEMTTRTASRTRYFALVEDGAGWLPGIVIRDPMSNWRFAAADDAMAEAEAVLADRDTLATAATALGLEPPTDLENAYETADSIDDLRAIDARLDDWIATSTQVAAARDALGVDRTPLVALGLLDARPDADYAAAVAAYAAGDAKAALAGSAGIVSLVVGAEAIGGQRATLGAGIAGMAMVLLVLAAFLVIRRRRRRPAVDPAQAAASGPDSYATLAASPDPVEGTEAGQPAARGAEPD